MLPPFLALMPFPFSTNYLIAPDRSGRDRARDLGLLAQAGVLLIVAAGQPRRRLAFSFGQGDLWAPSGSVGWAVYSILLRVWPSALGLPAVIATHAAAGALVLLPPALAESA